MPPYPVLCCGTGCDHPARFKIASRWSDGATHELKTYALCCSDCLAEEFSAAQCRHAACRVAHHEALEPPGVYEMHRGARDRQLMRRADLETAS
jgi:hypothetical protein